MARFTQREWQIAREVYSITPTDPGFHWYVRIHMAGKAEGVFKFLFSMSCMAVHTIRYPEIHAVAFIACLVPVRAIRYQIRIYSIGRRFVRPVTFMALGNFSNIEMAEVILEVTSQAVRSEI